MSLVEKVNAEIQTIIDEEIKALKEIETRVGNRVQETSEKIKELIQSYVELEKTLGKIQQLDLMGLTSNTAKVIDWVEESKHLNVFINTNEISFNISARKIFFNHPSGPNFKLDPEKKYKLLVAFIPVEDKA